LKDNLATAKEQFDKRFEEKKRKLTQGDELPPGVQKNGEGLLGRETQNSAWR